MRVIKGFIEIAKTYGAGVITNVIQLMYQYWIDKEDVNGTALIPVALLRKYGHQVLNWVSKAAFEK